MKVRIVNALPDNWYKNGEVYEVSECSDRYFRANESKTIAKSHCEIINEDYNEMKARCINSAIGLLRAEGYKVEKPKPTDEEICDMIKSENAKIGYVADWSNTNLKYYIFYCNDSNRYTYDSVKYSRTIGTTYTTKEIAERLCEELNS